jgi:hypothetical protein
MAHSSLRNHRKLKRLAKELPSCPVPKLIGHLQLLWWDVYETTSVKSDGRLVGWSANDIEAVCEWDGGNVILLQAFVSSGFIDLADGVYLIHDYIDWAPEFVKKRWKRLLECPDNGGQRQPTADNGGQRPPTKPNQTKPNQTKHNAEDKPPRTRGPNPIRDPLWDALAKQFFPNGVPPGKATLMGKCVTDLVAMKAVPSDVAVRALNYTSQIPDCVLTLRALVNNWETCREPKGEKDPSKVRKADTNLYERKTLRFTPDGRRINNETGRPYDSEPFPGLTDDEGNPHVQRDS